jgi:hypothetical protein
MRFWLSTLFILASVAMSSGQDVKPMAPMLVRSGGIVKGQPYSAEAVTESTQTLADGNKIVRRSVSRLYRDTEGRTRREDMKSQVGVPGAVVDVPQSVSITDPVAGVRYDLDTKRNIARASDFRGVGFAMPAMNPMPAFKMPTMNVHPVIKVATNESVNSKGVHTPLSEADQARIAELRQEQGQRSAERAKEAEQRQAERAKMQQDRERQQADRQKEAEARRLENEKAKALEDSRTKREDLGVQNIEGVTAQGTRTTTIIPAGQIGNERDIEVVNERWYSTDLQVTVMSRHSDPRSGEQVYRLTNINRNDPAITLFAPPADFTIEDHRAPRPPATPKVSTTPRRSSLVSRRAGTN